jgi:hypothetical protein
VTDLPPSHPEKKAARQAGRIAVGSSTVLSVTGTVPFVEWLFTLFLDPAKMPNLAVISFIAGMVVASINLGLQLFLRGRAGASSVLEGEPE